MTTNASTKYLNGNGLKAHVLTMCKIILSDTHTLYWFLELSEKLLYPFSLVIVDTIVKRQTRSLLRCNPFQSNSRRIYIVFTLYYSKQIVNWITCLCKWDKVLYIARFLFHAVVSAYLQEIFSGHCWAIKRSIKVKVWMKKQNIHARKVTRGYLCKVSSLYT